MLFAASFSLQQTHIRKKCNCWRTASRIDNFRMQCFSSVVQRCYSYVQFSLFHALSLCPFSILLFMQLHKQFKFCLNNNSIAFVAFYVYALVYARARVCPQFTTTTVVIYSIEQNIDSSKRTVFSLNTDLSQLMYTYTYIHTHIASI